MFDRSAPWYDAFYDALGKDYTSEAAHLARLIHSRVSDAATLLDVACGTGRHVGALSDEFDCTGVDVDAQLLEIARTRCPSGSFVKQDMATLDLDRTFDVVTCLFSSIGYVVHEAALDAAIDRMASHIHPGGLVIVEPWIVREAWTSGHVQLIEAGAGGARAARMMVSSGGPDVSVLDAHYLLGTSTGIEHFTEQHRLGLFSRDRYLAAFTAAGLLAEWDEDGLTGRGLIIGTRTT